MRGGWRGMEACHLYTAVSFISSGSPLPPPTRLSPPRASPLVASVAVAARRLRDAFEHLKKVVFRSRARRPAAAEMIAKAADTTGTGESEPKEIKPTSERV